MTEPREDLTPDDEELERQDGEEFPGRDTTPPIDENLVVPVNAAVAANILTDAMVYLEPDGPFPQPGGNGDHPPPDKDDTPSDG